MGLPGSDWRNRQLAGIDEVAGGYQNKMANPVTGGAGFAMSVVVVTLWLLSLVPLCLWSIAKRLLRRG